MKNINNFFHLTSPSPWPLITSFALMFSAISFIKTFQFKLFMNLIPMTFLSICVIQWWKNLSNESTSQGFHSLKLTENIKTSMILFIFSEIMFFLAFFWTLFHMFFSPNIEIWKWPPYNIMLINPYNLPLLNTIILLSSGFFLTLAHYSIFNKFKLNFYMFISMTIIYGILFTSIQLFEYFQSPFSMNDSIFGSSFFLMTGFHGIHVIIGTIFIISSIMNSKMFKINNIHHLNFELSAWYWHFVDVIWLFLFLFVYWWPIQQN